MSRDVNIQRSLFVVKKFSRIWDGVPKALPIIRRWGAINCQLFEYDMIDFAFPIVVINVNRIVSSATMVQNSVSSSLQDGLSTPSLGNIVLNSRFVVSCIPKQDLTEDFLAFPGRRRKILASPLGRREIDKVVVTIFVVLHICIVYRERNPCHEPKVARASGTIHTPHPLFDPKKAPKPRQSHKRAVSQSLYGFQNKVFVPVLGSILVFENIQQQYSIVNGGCGNGQYYHGRGNSEGEDCMDKDLKQRHKGSPSFA
mmetsp:Transcript_6155/g.17524  ORF Transcript_6155/g.17524 Transcript_6155/m.17524 type:complete len:256 (-) Transcript_6155:1539-2306(-)